MKINCPYCGFEQETEKNCYAYFLEYDPEDGDSEEQYCVNCSEAFRWIAKISVYAFKVEIRERKNGRRR